MSFLFIYFRFVYEICIIIVTYIALLQYFAMFILDRDWVLFEGEACDYQLSVHLDAGVQFFAENWLNNLYSIQIPLCYKLVFSLCLLALLIIWGI